MQCSYGYSCVESPYGPTCVPPPPGHPKYFSDLIKQYVVNNSADYNAWTSEAKGKYQSGGYYASPYKTQPVYYIATTYPTNASNQCFQDQYYANGYCMQGYDATGYDPFGYDEAGYDKQGWSRYGADTNSQYNALGQLRNPAYAGLMVKFNPDGTVKTKNGQVLRYDKYGYDQYGQDQYGRSKPPPCTNKTTTTPPPPPPPNQPPGGDVNPTCDSPSSVAGANGGTIYLRKSVVAMTTADWARYRAAWHTLNSDGRVSAYTRIHGTILQQHGTLKFLPWHREFLARFEDELHRVDPCVYVPYWDVVASRQFPAGIATNIEPNWPPAASVFTNGLLTGTDPVTRAVGAGTTLPDAALLDVAIAQTDFGTFSTRLEQYHNAIHVYVGGDMSLIAQATQDPVFWTVHAYIDKVWNDWSATHSGQPDGNTITSINPLQFGDGSPDKVYTQESNTEAVATTGGLGYRYI